MWRIWPWWWKTQMSGSPWWCYLTQSCVLSRSIILLVCVCVFFSLWKLSVYKMSEGCLNPRSTSITLWLFIKSVSAFPTWPLAHSRQGINDFCGWTTTVKRRKLLTGGSFLSYCRGVSSKSGETGRNRMVSAIGTAINAPLKLILLLPLLETLCNTRQITLGFLHIITVLVCADNNWILIFFFVSEI